MLTRLRAPNLRAPLRRYPSLCRDACPERATLGCGPLRRGCHSALGGRQHQEYAETAAGALARGRRKKGCKLPYMLPLLSGPLAYFFFPAFFRHCVTSPRLGLAASCGVETSRLQRPSLRAGSTTRHPILHASFDERWKACGRQSHLSDGFLERPGSSTGRLHQHQVQGLTQRRTTPYASLSAAPSGRSPVSRKRHRAMRNLRATATIPMRLRRCPPPLKRSRNQQLRALSGW
jgi:hypothetical protein